MPGGARLAAARLHARDRLEVRGQHDRAPLACHLADLAVDDPLRLERALAFRCVPVVDDDVRNLAGVADADEERDVALAAALEHEDPLLVDVDAERLEDEREDQLLRPSLDEHRTAGEEQLRAVAVELGEDAEGLGLGERFRLEELRTAVPAVPDERQLLEPVDAEEDGGVRRVEDLVALLREPAQDAVKAPLRVGAEIQLRLLDQQHEAAQVRADQALHPLYES